MALLAEHNLLFGLLALQNGLIDQVQLVAAFQAWTRDKVKTLAEYLIDRGDIDDADRAAVEVLVSRNLKKHGSAEKSLASLPARIHPQKPCTAKFRRPGDRGHSGSNWNPCR